MKGEHLTFDHHHHEKSNVENGAFNSLLQSDDVYKIRTNKNELDRISKLLHFNSSSVYSPLIPWHKSLIPPVKFNLKVNNKVIEVIYDNKFPISIGSISLLGGLKCKWERLPRSKSIPIINCSFKYENCQTKACLLFAANNLELPFKVFCTTRKWQQMHLYLGQDFGEQYIHLLSMHKNILTLSDGKTNTNCPFQVMRSKRNALVGLPKTFVNKI